MVIWLLLAQSSLVNQNQSFVHVLLFKNILNRIQSIYLEAFQTNYLKSIYSICISHSLNFTERPMLFKMKFKTDTFLEDARCTY